MKISNVIPYVAWIGFRNQLLVKVEADNGQYGWGESGLSGRELAVEGAVKHYREFLLGKDPRQIGGLWQEMYRSQYFEGGARANRSHLRYRHRPVRSCRQGTERAGPPIARRGST